MSKRLFIGLITATSIIGAVSIKPTSADQAQESPSSASKKTVTAIDGRMFDFPVPDEMSPNLFDKVQEEFLVGVLNTPSPPRKLWAPYDRLLIDKKQRAFIEQYLNSKPPATADEVQALLGRVKKGMIFVKGGTFDMGDYGYLTPKKLPMTDNTIDDPPHKVTIDSYSLMKNRVTFADYDIYTRANHLPPLALDNSLSMELAFPNFPAFLKWQQGRDYCLWLAKETGQKFDIDTEAQYEYAARSGGKWLFLASTFEKPNELVPDLQKFKKFTDSQDKDVSPATRFGLPIGTYGHNYLGFEDMVGSIDEWVYDWFSPYTKAPLVNPHGPDVPDAAWGPQRVTRSSPIEDYGTTYRQSHNPDEPGATFRCSISSTHAWN